MALDLDERQRAMLQEMGVRVWLPGAAFEVLGAGDTATVAMPPARPSGSPTASPSTAQNPVTGVANGPRTVADRAVTVRTTSTSAPPKAAAYETVSTSLNVQALDWPALADSAAQCQACGLCTGRKNTTLQMPASNAQADWFFVGDAPDEDEDEAGQAFAGQAGLLLDNMLKAMQARRGDVGAAGVYATSIVKCRPPLSRLPLPEEVAQCAAYLQREIALIQPKVIVAMGRVAIQHVLQEHPDALTLPLGKQRGVVYHYLGVPVVVTYAPKMLLRASSDKGKAWADLCLALDVRDGLG